MRLLATMFGLLALGTHGVAERQHTIASATVEDFRVVVRAIEGPDDGGAPLASVRLEALVKKGGSWRLVGRRTVGRPNGFFWFPLTGPGAIRQFSVESFPVRRVRFQLLITPSAGFSPLYRFHLEGARLVPG